MARVSFVVAVVATLQLAAAALATAQAPRRPTASPMRVQVISFEVRETSSRVCVNAGHEHGVTVGMRATFVTRSRTPGGEIDQVKRRSACFTTTASADVLKQTPDVELHAP